MSSIIGKYKSNEVTNTWQTLKLSVKIITFKLLFRYFFSHLAIVSLQQTLLANYVDIYCKFRLDAFKSACIYDIVFICIYSKTTGKQLTFNAELQCFSNKLLQIQFIWALEKRRLEILSFFFQYIWVFKGNFNYSQQFEVK